jgi:hypothetical protein
VMIVLAVKAQSLEEVEGVVQMVLKPMQNG